MRIKRFQEPSGPLDYASIYLTANPGSLIITPRIDILRDLDKDEYGMPYSKDPLEVMYDPSRANPNGHIVSLDASNKWERSPFAGVEKTVGTAYLVADVLRGIYKLGRFAKLPSRKLYTTTLTRRTPTKTEIQDAYNFISLGKNKAPRDKYANLLSNLPTLESTYGKNIPIEELALANRPTTDISVPHRVATFYTQDVAPRLFRYLTIVQEPHYIKADDPYAMLDISKPLLGITMQQGFVPKTMGGWYDTSSKTLRIAENGSNDIFAHELRHAALNLLEGADGNLTQMPPGLFRINATTRRLLNDAYRFDPNGQYSNLTMYPELSEKQATNTLLRYKLWDKFGWNNVNEGNKIIDNISDEDLLTELGNTNGYGADFVNTIGRDLDQLIEAVESIVKSPGTSVEHIMDNNLATRVAKKVSSISDPVKRKAAIEKILSKRMLSDAASRIRLALKYSPAFVGPIMYNQNEHQSKQQEI